MLYSRCELRLEPALIKGSLSWDWTNGCECIAQCIKQDVPVTESLSLDALTSHDDEEDEDEEEMPVIVENTPSASDAIAGLELAL